MLNYAKIGDIDQYSLHDIFIILVIHYYRIETYILFILVFFLVNSELSMHGLAPIGTSINLFK